MGIAVFPPAASGPTLAEITSAITTNAASAGVTNASIASAITSNAASAGVTLAAIGTQVANNASPYGGTFTNVATYVANGVNGFTFSGLSGYKYYRLYIYLENLSGTSSTCLRFNGDAGFNYTYYTVTQGASAASANTNDSLVIFSNSSAAKGVALEIPAANSTTSDKIIFGNNGAQGSGITPMVGLWRNTSAINSINIFLTGGNIGSWNVRLLGIN